MKDSPLTPSEFLNGRKHFYIFTFFNVLSFLLISSNIIILYALKLGAGSFIIGLLSSFIQIAYLFMLPGRALITKAGAVKLMGRFWALRYLMMLPVLVTPLLYYNGLHKAALYILILSVLGFNISRGIAITSYNPIIGQLAGTKDRGVFLSRIQIITHTIVISLGIIMAISLGNRAPLFRYALFIAAGITAGLIGCYFIFKLPELKGSASVLTEPLSRSFILSIKDKGFRKFITVLLLSSLAMSMLAPFIIVYFKKIYQNTDSQIIFFTVFGGLGALSMAVINGFMIDRIGSKPLILIYSFITSAIIIPLIISPVFKTAVSEYIFAGLIFFLSYMGTNGILNTSQNYFLASIKPQERLNLGIIYFLTMGVSGAIGSLAGGTVLQALQNILNSSNVDVFRLYFGSILFLFIIINIFILRLNDISAYSVRDAFAIIFSPRDLRAISLLNRLKKTRTITEERDVIQALGSSGSSITRNELLQKLHSPSFLIRAEALSALNHIPIDSHIETVLISEVKNHKFTTAYMAAEIIGQKKVVSGEKVLQQALNSKDYFLVGKAMVALAKLKSSRSVPEILRLIEESQNPRVVIHGAHAMEIFKDKRAIGVLIKKMEKKTSPYVRDEIILAIAGILDMLNWFYTRYTIFLESAQSGTLALLDDLKTQGKTLKYRKELMDTVENVTRNQQLFKKLSLKFFETEMPDYQQNVKDNVYRYFKNALNNDQILKLDRFRFLTAALLTYFSL
ncbi:MAG: hypothetical protein GXP33_09325 [Spirochaetes bacterium]|nr:hypothetical protein [Spirochaetota bacterium]